MILHIQNEILGHTGTLTGWYNLINERLFGV